MDESAEICCGDGSSLGVVHFVVVAVLQENLDIRSGMSRPFLQETPKALMSFSTSCFKAAVLHFVCRVNMGC